MNRLERPDSGWYRLSEPGHIQWVLNGTDVTKAEYDAYHEEGARRTECPERPHSEACAPKGGGGLSGRMEFWEQLRRAYSAPDSKETR